jgi:hypothetical protein
VVLSDSKTAMDQQCNVLQLILGSRR